ncbi:asparagine synthase (glutamine-hydrolyzing), partial [Candidatus Woesearchaeota archaeon]|nr:asparagine synthase (glutamine-hydrolyzing) [Candidatus Woesearchaeota archaeon]
EKGRNPLWNAKKDKLIIYNGETYNFQEIRQKLLKKGYKFKSRTDTEVILLGYEEWGVKILEMLNGMFAFCIYDLKNKDLFIARDRLGIKPLYYYFKKSSNPSGKSKFIFASEIKAILRDSSVKRVPNKQAVAEYLTFQNILDDKTFFEGIKMLEPGHYLKFSLKGRRATPVIIKYWDFTFKYKERSNSQVKEEFLHIIHDSVKRHMISDVEVGTYLSGGFDSGTVTTIASMESKNKLNTFTCKFDVKGEFDETSCSREVAQKAGANIHELKITRKDFIETIEKMVYHMDEPRIGIPVISMYNLSRFVSKKVKVVMTGHGGDELFAGYPVFQAKAYKDEMKKNPARIPKIIYTVLKDKKRMNIMYYLFLPVIFRQINSGIITVFLDKDMKKAFTRRFNDETRNYDSQEVIAKVLAGNKKSKNYSEIEKVQYLYLRTYLPSLFLAEDKMGMAASIEARFPICDKEMIDFALSVPIEQKLTGGELKYVMKESMRGILPDVVYQQEKRGFPTPLGEWLEKGLDKYFEEILLSDRCINRGIFKKQYMEKLLKKTDFWNVNKLWCLLNIEIWYRLYIDNQSPA